MEIEALFNPERRKQAIAYNKEKRRQRRVAFFIEVLFWFIILGFSLEKVGFNYLKNLGLYYEFEVIIYLLVFFLLYSLLSLITAYQEYKLDRKYQLSNQELREWLVDEIKSSVLGLIFFYLAVRTYLYLLVKFPEIWWIYFTIIASVFILLITFIFPIILLPLFFKLEGYPESELKERLWKLVRKAEVKIDDIYEINLSTKVNAANAAVMGLGSSRKVVLSDNLKDKYSNNEIEAILAHELGHQVHRDILKNILVEPLIILPTAYLVFKIWPVIVSWAGYASIDSVMTIPLLILIVGLLSWLLSPLGLYLSRKWEKRADLYAVKITDKGNSLVKALAKLADEGLSPLTVSRYEEIFKFSHPPMKKRIEYILDIKKSRLMDL